MKDCLIIGAGIAGLTAARTLAAEGVRVTVLDKGRGVGGRLATRRIEDGVFDHGAQFITARHAIFQALLAEMRQEDVIYEWCRGIGTPAEPHHDDGHPRYQGTGGMTAIPKYLARGLDVRIRHRVAHVRLREGQWHAHVESGQVFSSGALICATPVRQALDLLDLGGYELGDSAREVLEGIKYNPCLAVMALLEGPSHIPAPGALREIDDSISFVCDNQQKGISPVSAVTIHASAAFSREHWGAGEEQVSSWILEKAAPYLASPVRFSTLHRWRFAQPKETFANAFLRVEGAPPLLFAGDAFDGPRVEGAALSGIAAANSLLGR